MIDFHMIYRNSGRSKFYNKAIASLANQQVYEIEDVGGIANSRHIGYAMGSNSFVSYCDDDDEVLDLDVVLGYMMANPDAKAIYTNSIFYSEHKKSGVPFYSQDAIHSQDGIFNGTTHVHQLIVVEREIAQLASKGALATVKDFSHACYDYAFTLEVGLLTEWHYIDHACYLWRQWNSNIQTHYRRRYLNNMSLIKAIYTERYNNAKR